MFTSQDPHLRTLIESAPKELSPTALKAWLEAQAAVKVALREQADGTVLVQRVLHD